MIYMLSRELYCSNPASACLLTRSHGGLRSGGALARSSAPGGMDRHGRRTLFVFGGAPLSLLLFPQSFILRTILSSPALRALPPLQAMRIDVKFLGLLSAVGLLASTALAARPDNDENLYARGIVRPHLSYLPPSLSKVGLAGSPAASRAGRLRPVSLLLRRDRGKQHRGVSLHLW